MLELSNLIEEGDAQKIAEYMTENGLTLEGDKIVPVKEKVDWVKGQISFWDQRQQAR